MASSLHITDENLLERKRNGRTVIRKPMKLQADLATWGSLADERIGVKLRDRERPILIGHPDAVRARWAERGQSSTSKSGVRRAF